MLPISVGMNYSDLTTWRHLKDGNKRYHPQMAELFDYFQVSELL